MRFTSILTITSLSAVIFSSNVVSGASLELKSEHNAVFRKWRGATKYRLLTQADNQNNSCSTNKTPYYVVADISGDGVEDFAVMVVNKTNESDALLLVFNGPFKRKIISAKPALRESIYFYDSGEIGAEGDGVISFCICETDNCGSWKWNGKKYEELEIKDDDADPGGESICVRGEPELLLSGNNPKIKSHSFVFRSKIEAVEEMVTSSGDRVIITNGGCEYYVNSFRYESAEISAGAASATYWGSEAAKALRKMHALGLTGVFDLVKAAETLEKLVKEPGRLSFDAEIPVEGDGTDFLQTRVILRGGGLLQGQAGGYVTFDLVKGPL